MLPVYYACDICITIVFNYIVSMILCIFEKKKSFLEASTLYCILGMMGFLYDV